MPVPHIADTRILAPLTHIANLASKSNIVLRIPLQIRAMDSRRWPSSRGSSRPNNVRIAAVANASRRPLMAAAVG